MAATSLAASPTATPSARLTDSHGRVIHDLRVSITDRCNYKCVYCRTGEVGAQYPELAIAEYLRLIRLFVGLGITKVRLTGGEPLLRRGLLDLVRELARMRTIEGGSLELALTTNGHLLDSLAGPLKAAGLNRVTVSMDAVDAATFERITRVPGSFAAVLGGVRAARAAGLTPLKINCVLLRGFNDGQVEGFARFAREEDVAVRFIEFMPLEEDRLWSPEIVVPLREIVERIGRVLPLVELVRELAALRTVEGRPLDLALTTNGHLLDGLAGPLKAAGLHRVTVSMDAVEAPVFERITRVPGSYEAVLGGIRAAREAGLTPLKVNCVLLRGFNDDQIESFAHFARREGVVVRFIEFMPLEEDRLWTPEIVVTLKEIVERLSGELGVVEVPRHEASETARRYTFEDGVGEIGIIAPVSQAFCGACSRVRLTSDGKIRTCLFSQVEHDLYGRMRGGGSDAELKDYIVRTIEQKEARHHIGEPGFLKPSRSMVHIGG